ncbi:hypothetical protein CR513_09758, partial [Mucuna pruriens]
MGTKYQLGAKLGYLVQIRTLDLHSIRYLSSCLKRQWCRIFEKMHSNLLQILEIETQPEVLEALMAPTLEEYERLLGLTLAESVSYFHQD